jgi:hypothetical protein
MEAPCHRLCHAFHDSGETSVHRCRMWHVTTPDYTCAAASLLQFMRDTGSKIAELEKRTKPKDESGAEHLAGAAALPNFMGAGGPLAIADVAYNQMPPPGYGAPPGYGGGMPPPGYGAPQGMMPGYGGMPAPGGYGGLPQPGYGMPPPGGMY